MTTTLYAPPDVARAYSEFRATCGPAALAAILRRPVMSVREFFPGFPAKPWCNPTTIKAALGLAGVGFSDTARGVPAPWPCYGLAFIQVAGPWCDKGVPVAAAYRFTHWVAVAEAPLPPACLAFAPTVMVYDINANGWLSRDQWAGDVMAAVVAARPRATGWWTRMGIEVVLPEEANHGGK